MAGGLRGKTAIVTGSSRGIGAQIAYELAKRGANYLRQEEAPGKIMQTTLSAFGDHIDILVNNAGCEVIKCLGDISVEDLSYVYDLNVRAVILMSKAVLPYLRARGRIINISSVASRSGFRDLSLYCLSKAAVEGLTRCFAARLGSQGHTVNAINSGPVQTDLLDGIPQEIVEMQKKMTPAENRLGTTDDTAQIVGFLSEESIDPYLSCWDQPP